MQWTTTLKSLRGMSGGIVWPSRTEQCTLKMTEAIEVYKQPAQIHIYSLILITHWSTSWASSEVYSIGFRTSPQGQRGKEQKTHQGSSGEVGEQRESKTSIHGTTWLFPTVQENLKTVFNKHCIHVHIKPQRTKHPGVSKSLYAGTHRHGWK